jgi:hypothetical protein
MQGSAARPRVGLLRVLPETRNLVHAANPRYILSLGAVTGLLWKQSNDS